jgi:hypothetical protein
MGKPLTQEQRDNWAERIHNQQNSGLSIQRWCQENQISAHVFHYWKKRLASKAPLDRSSFTELVSPKGCTFIIEYQGVRVHFESSSLKQCLAVLRELKC